MIIFYSIVEFLQIITENPNILRFDSFKNSINFRKMRLFSYDIVENSEKLGSEKAAGRTFWTGTCKRDIDSIPLHDAARQCYVLFAGLGGGNCNLWRNPFDQRGD